MEQRINDSSNRDIWILHLSDLHLGPNTGDIERILIRLDEVKLDWESVTNVRQPDLCMITGDLTHTGSEKEYANLTVFVNRLKEWLNVDSSGHMPIFIVPGNHDQVRSSLQGSMYDYLLKFCGEKYQRLRIKRERGERNVYLKLDHPHFTDARTNPITANNIWANENDAWELGVLPRFNNYDMWLRKELPHLVSIGGLKGGCWCYSTEVKNVQLGIVGLNSAVASTGWDEDLDHRYLWLSAKQISMALNKYDLFGSSIVALMHHPFHILAHSDTKADGSVPLLKKRACLVLSGHVHGCSWGDMQAGTHDAPNIYARAFGDPRGGTSHGYNIIHLGSDSTIQYLRAWVVNKSGYAEDTSVGPRSGEMTYDCGYIDQADGKHEFTRYPIFSREPIDSLMVEVEPFLTFATPMELLPQIELYASQPRLPKLSMLILMVMRLSEVSTSSTVSQIADELIAVLKKQGHDIFTLVQDKVADLASEIEEINIDESR